ncbi:MULTISPECIES: 5'-methylthioadenosine/adenosylhomocysteine nucleosidase [Psychrilyobacter]|uniref:adenosylhomocysteine nucleosidase n=1 Tax=Psychrilyobacter piezotolerans TaxID=2293438 RepID=A0ABX9KHN7_9FUSO|nr:MULTISPECIES: 5'-methylthioadenosine/adenosylhomocysteine nucleosidase [Psychrilyobacter]MCS5421185.1 5'-methylthioadenosine/adenosylhomocysteine nucleosidase [Psychrilyobacter sp. S5]NDI77624.1 5'-methylthioadenosine/adenosylhomocysteine nucleosidase [Psychrilyobacter piezotolerans]RDE62633.1 5'-methylthioadenosine/adenosylhomocysteine nucleosidase [Psychrilyobacter sp. S5]REI41563.1 5'-methylthioadenosine/adenosylhomocysteine nucleosidase [Psychrilyobacter piezotolerans]
MIGIIGAMHEEIIELKNMISNLEEEKILDIIFYKGTLEGKEIVLVEGGIGKVNASVCTTLLIDRFKVNQLIFTGVAGGTNPNIEVGDIVISNELMEHDFDCTAFGMKHGEIPRMETSIFKADEKLIKIAEKSALELFDKKNIYTGRIVSGDVFVAEPKKINWLRETFNSECTEMEGAAVAHVCHLFKTPFVIIRSISDKANDDAKTDFQEFVKLASKNSKNLIVEMMKRV